MKFVLTSIALAIAITGCSKTEPQVTGMESLQEPEKAVSQARQLTPDEARTQAQDFVGQLTRQENFIADLHRNTDADGLEKVAMEMFAGVTPGGDLWQQKSMEPYYACDTAWRDLAVLTSAMHHELDETTPVRRKIVADELADYEKNKARCLSRVEMTAQEAIAAEDAE